jgi:cation diffusion facilitator CzcD-associated flavoprotein CzcO
MCDVESYIYLPLLEETKYVPKHRYAAGHEIRQYVESLCTKYGLHGQAMFQSRGKRMTWNETKKTWTVEITKRPKGGDETTHTLHSEFVIIAPGMQPASFHLGNSC